MNTPRARPLYALGLCLVFLALIIPLPGATAETDGRRALANCVTWGSHMMVGTRPPLVTSILDCVVATRADLPAANRASAHSFIAQARAAEGRYAEAVHHYEEAIRLAPQGLSFVGLGDALTRLGRFGEAVPALREALRRMPDELRAWIHAERRETEQPEKVEAAAHRLMATASSTLGYALHRQERWEEALRADQETVRWSAGDAAPWGRMALAAARLQRDGEAVSYWERALLIQPSYFDTHDAERRAWEATLRRAGRQPPAPVPSPYRLTVDSNGAERPARPALEGARSGTGFVVSKDWHVLTAAHLVEGCRVVGSGPLALRVVAVDRPNDIALVRFFPGPEEPGSLATTGRLATLTEIRARLLYPLWGKTAVFRERPAVRPGEAVVVVGFPLPDVLGAGGKVTSGDLSALGGSGTDRRYQTTAPIQPGHSGGPLLDRSGNVIGLIVARLGAKVTAKDTVDVPQNVNFAVPLEILRSFLDQHGVAYQRSASSRELSVADVGERARAYTLPVECRE